MAQRAFCQSGTLDEASRRDCYALAGSIDTPPPTAAAAPDDTLQAKAEYIDARPLTASSTKPLATHGRTIHRVTSDRFAMVAPCPLFSWKRPNLCAALSDALGHGADIRRVGYWETYIPQPTEAGPTGLDVADLLKTQLCDFAEAELSFLPIR